MTRGGGYEWHVQVIQPPLHTFSRLDVGRTRITSFLNLANSDEPFISCECGGFQEFSIETSVSSHTAILGHCYHFM